MPVLGEARRLRLEKPGVHHTLLSTHPKH
jgi:hypothetical protein